MFTVWKTNKPESQANQPRCWPTYEELFAVLSSRMARDGYKIVKARSHRGRVNGAEVATSEMVRVDLVCDRGGRPYTCHATKHRTSTKKTGCPWKAKAVKRKSVGGWTLDIVIDEHNHEPGTPEPPVGEEGEEEEDAEGEADASDGVAAASTMAPPPPPPPHLPLAPDREPPSASETAAAMREGPPAPFGPPTSHFMPPDMEGIFPSMAELTRGNLRLSGDTFHKIKQRYRKMSRPQRVNIQAHIQFHLAALAAVENEDVQRQHSQDIINRRHAEVAMENQRLLEHENQKRMVAIASGRVVTPRKRPAGMVSPAAVIDEAMALISGQEEARPGGPTEDMGVRSSGDVATDALMARDQALVADPHHQHHQPPPPPQPQPHMQPPLTASQAPQQFPSAQPLTQAQPLHFPPAPESLSSFTPYALEESNMMHPPASYHPNKKIRAHRQRK
jgi:hypothetical protein